MQSAPQTEETQVVEDTSFQWLGTPDESRKCLTALLEASLGAEAPVDFVGFMRGVKPPPPSELGFSASCEVVP